MKSKTYELSVTTQGPSYPPSEVMDKSGNFIVIGYINRVSRNGDMRSEWGRAIVAADTPMPPFGQNLPYRIVQELGDPLSSDEKALILHTLPLPLPCNNYPMVFAPKQCPQAALIERPSYPFHQVPIPDLREQDGRKLKQPVTLGDWVQARASLHVEQSANARAASFDFRFEHLIPHSLYTVMGLRQQDLYPDRPSRPGPLGVPNVFITDEAGCAVYSATLSNPFPDATRTDANRIVNVVVLWMSYQMNYGGAIGLFGLGGDIHAQLKLPQQSFYEFTTHS